MNRLFARLRVVIARLRVVIARLRVVIAGAVASRSGVRMQTPEVDTSFFFVLLNKKFNYN